MRFWIVFLILIAQMAWTAHAAPNYRRDYRQHPGYLDTSTTESREEPSDLIPAEQPKPEVPFNERIFNDTLSKEFQEKYEQQFGYTEQERRYNNPVPYYVKFSGPFNQLQDQQASDAHTKFGNYMIKRLAEYHVENYAKNDPTVRPVWEVKEKLSNIKIEVNKVRFDVRYSLVGNTLDVKMINNWMLTELSLIMDPGAFGPTPPSETILTLGKDITQTVNFRNAWKMMDGVMTWTLVKVLTPLLSTSITLVHNTKSEGTSPRQTVYLAGVSWGF